MNRPILRKLPIGIQSFEFLRTEGYLTIKAYDKRFQLYTFGFPNEEVKYGFLNFAAPFYTADKRKPIKIGISFDPEERNLGEWIIEE